MAREEVQLPKVNVGESALLQDSQDLGSHLDSATDLL